MPPSGGYNSKTMTTITLTVVAEWLSEDAQRQLEQRLSQLEAIKDFVFNEKGNLEVTFEYESDTVYVINLCNISIQNAMYQSGKARMAKILSENELFI